MKKVNLIELSGGENYPKKRIGETKRRQRGGVRVNAGRGGTQKQKGQNNFFVNRGHYSTGCQSTVREPGQGSGESFSGGSTLSKSMGRGNWGPGERNNGQ